MSNTFMKLFFVFFILLFSNELFSQQNGSIQGIILDEETQSPIEGAIIEILSADNISSENLTGLKTQTNENGEFILRELNFGNYQIKVSAIGYEPILKTDLVIYASRPLEVTLILTPQGFLTDEINVQANFFQKKSDINISFLNLDYEEIRRAPGAVEDISRMLQSAPGVSIGNDQRNDLIVRGGSPSENLILIDGIEIPNINHFGTQGSSSGAISFINSKFILDADMFTGGFPSLYGDRLSSVLNIKFREGSYKNHFQDINLSIAGFGGIFEGPLSDNSSYLFSVRRSYLELIQNSIRLAAVPNYWDINMKINFNAGINDKLTLIGFSGIDKIEFSGETEDDNPYGKSNANQNAFVTGLNWTRLFSNGYLQSVVSNSYSGYDIIQFEINDESITRFKSNAYENELTFKSDLNFRLNNFLTLNSGIGGKYINLKNELFLKGDTNAAGYVYEAIDADAKTNTYKLFGHINLTSKFFNDKFILNTGLRVDRFDYIRLKNTFSPRVGISYKLDQSTALNGAYGIYFQNPQYIWVTSHPENYKLNSIRSEHFIAGIEHFFNDEIKATLEVYEKRYKDYPVWKDIPTFILIDGGADNGPNIVGEAVSAGNGYVRGIDFSIQKKLTKNGLYGLINYSFSNSGFTAIEGGEKPGEFDPGHQFTIIAGYQFKNDWLVGIKWKYAGGRPYTPYNIVLSEQNNRGIFATTDFNSVRYPYYMRVDLRVDKKFNFKKVSVVGYLEIQNLFNRENIYNYFWNEQKNKLGTIYQWAFFPVGGVSVQF